MSHYDNALLADCPAAESAIQNIDRVVLVDEHGRVYERHNVQVQLSFQDDGQTLKVVVKARDLAAPK